MKLGYRFPILMLARRNLARAKIRSALAVLGIVIGVLAISSLGFVGLAFQESQYERFGTLPRTMIVTPGADAEFSSFNDDHVTRIERTAGDATVVPIKGGRTTVRHLRTEQSVDVRGVDDLDGLYDAESGEIPDSWRSGVVLGNDVADDLNASAGDSVTLDGETRRVRGVLESESRLGVVMQPDAKVFRPPSRMEGGYFRVSLLAESPNRVTELRDQLDSDLNGRKEVYAIQDFESNLQQFNALMSQIQIFLLVIGGISLVVAGVSILNVMLMSTVERQGELGILRAVGYRRIDTLRLILTEAALLGVGGAIVGTLLAALTGMAVNLALLGDPMAFQPGAVTYAVLGFGFGILSTVVSGAYPAWRAANMEPVNALRE